MAPKKKGEERPTVTNLNDLKRDIIVGKPVGDRKQALEGM